MLLYKDDRALAPWSTTGTSGANTAQNLTVSAAAGRRHVAFSYVVAARGGTPGEVTIAIKTASTTIWTDAIRTGNHRAQHRFVGGLMANVGEDMVLAVSAGGSGVITEANLEGATA